MTKVAGRCPMGCGETLFVGNGGHITCSLIGCPKPVAVDALLNDPIAADERARASRADAELRSALESALRELKRNAATWITLEPILSAHVYEYAPRGDGHVWTAYTRFARPEQALAVAEKARAALAGVSHGE